jgi:hypothetical protein
VNQTEINVGITSLKSLRDGRVIIEVGSRKEMESQGGKLGKRAKRNWKLVSSI